jgi:hypothetical protein
MKIEMAASGLLLVQELLTKRECVEVLALKFGSSDATGRHNDPP